MQMQSVETSAGTAICCAPSRMAWMIGLPMSRLRLTFSTSTVASSTRMPTASASPPSVMMLRVSPSRLSVMTEVRIESGMDTAMMSVLRQLPRKSRIIKAVRQAAMSASRITPLTAARTKMDWSASGWTLSSGGRVGITQGQQRTDAGHDVERGGGAALQNGDERPTAAIPADDVRLGREPIAHMGDVAKIDRRVADHLDREVIQLGHGPRAGIHGDVVLERTDLGGAGGQHDVLLTNGGDDIGRRNPFRLEQARVQVDHDLALLTAVRVGDGRARHRDELGPQEVEADVVELRLGHPG